MDHHEVLVFGIFDPDGKQESFCYTHNAPTNLWIGALCDDGSRMHVDFMTYILNGLMEDDAFNEGDTFVVRNQDGVSLTATVGAEVAARSVDAFQALTDTVRKVSVHVGE
jgi:hypothetical protein